MAVTLLKLRATVASQLHFSSSVFGSLFTVSADMVVFLVHKNVIKMYLTFTNEEYTNMNFVIGFYNGSRDYHGGTYVILTTLQNSTGKHFKIYTVF
jgi:hypothetical protein